LEPVQDMMLEGAILDDARAADDALAAGSREEQQAVAQKKLKDLEAINLGVRSKNTIGSLSKEVSDE